MSTTLDQLYALIAEGEIDQALKKLQGILSMGNSELVNDALLLSAQYKKLKSDIRKGILDYDQETVATNRIVDRLISLVDEMKEEQKAWNQFTQMEHDMDQTMMERNQTEMSEERKDTLFLRMSYMREKKISARALWIDDSAGNQYECGVLESLGIAFDRAASSAEALALLEAKNYDLVVSDVERNGDSREGIRFLRDLPGHLKQIPFIFYVGRVDRSRGVPPWAFGIADNPGDLAHLALDVLERRY